MKLSSLRGKIKLSTLWQEFKAFAFKGNMIDLALAVVIGGAFGKIVSAVNLDVITPLIGLVVSVWGKAEVVAGATTRPGGEIFGLAKLNYHGFLFGDLISEIINFLIMAAVIFLVIVKILGSIMKAAAPSTPTEPTTKECPKCFSVIAIKATKCAFCTADLPEVNPTMSTTVH